MRTCYHPSHSRIVSPARAERAGAGAGRVRIVGGSLRGSRLNVIDAPGLRPTPDRVRETLFNWLAPVIDGAHCLDLFAGSGALGIEALSRGAATVDLVEGDARLAGALRANLARLKQDAQVHCQDALQFVGAATVPYDIVFLDPPFVTNLWTTAARALEDRALLKPGALVYVETPAGAAPELPSAWRAHRQSRAGAVAFALYRRAEASAKL